MFDGSTATFEGLKRPDAVEILASAGDKVILLRQEQPSNPVPYRCLPGGRVDDGEEPLAAAKRELLEETGYASGDWQAFRRWQPPGKIDGWTHTFVARDCRQAAPQQLDGGERIIVQLVTLEEFLDETDKETFRHLGIKPDFVRAKYDPASRKQFRQLLFGR